MDIIRWIAILALFTFGVGVSFGAGNDLLGGRQVSFDNELLAAPPPPAPPPSLWAQTPVRDPSIDEEAAACRESRRTGKPLFVWVRFFDRMFAQRMPQAIHLHLDRDYWGEEGPAVVVTEFRQGFRYKRGRLLADDCSEANLLRMAGLPASGDARPARRVGGWGMADPEPTFPVNAGPATQVQAAWPTASAMRLTLTRQPVMRMAVRGGGSCAGGS